MIHRWQRANRPLTSDRCPRLLLTHSYNSLPTLLRYVTQPGDRIDVVNLKQKIINTHRNDFLVIKSRCLTYSSSVGVCAGRRRPVRARRGFATVQRLNISTRSSELLGNPPCLQGLTGHCYYRLFPNEWTTQQVSLTRWAGYSFFLLSFGFMAGCKRDLLCKPPPTVLE